MPGWPPKIKQQLHHGAHLPPIHGFTMPQSLEPPTVSPEGMGSILAGCYPLLYPQRKLPNTSFAPLAL